jgi:hypothetical protein
MPIDPIAASAARRLPMHALLFGGVAGAVGCAVRWAEFAFGFYGRAAELCLLFVPLIAIILAVQRWRDGALAGAINFSRAIGAGLAVGMIYSVLHWIFAWVLVHHLEPDLLETMAAFQREGMQAAGRTAEEIATADQRFRAEITADIYPKIIFAHTLVVTFIGSLLAALFIRKRVST